MFDYGTFEHLRRITVLAMQRPWDITFSENILFVAEYSSGLIHRIPLKSIDSTTNWSVGCEKLTLSAVKTGNILVTSRSKGTLVEYTTTGQRLREIHLPQKEMFGNPLHAIHMDNDRFLVSHGRQISLIDNNGLLIKSYGPYGSQPGELSNPYHLAADVNGFCLAVEFTDANRIILFNDELEFVKELIPQSGGLKNPIPVMSGSQPKEAFCGGLQQLSSCYI